MKALHQLLQHWWYGSKSPPWLLRQVSRWHQALVPARTRIRQHDYPVQIIVVGNIVAGGAGKTPTVIAICRLLAQHGYRVGVISRGYGRALKGVIEVFADSAVENVGDEPLLIQQTAQVPVAVAEQRLDALTHLLSKYTLDVVISDDGLQHQALPRDLDICLVDGRRGLGNGLLLPAGPLREPPECLAQMDRVLYKECQPAGLPRGEVIRLALGPCTNLADGRVRALQEWRGRPVQALAAIANPESFFAALQAAGVGPLRRYALADHQPVSAALAEQIHSRGSVLMTSKDAIKWPSAHAQHAWVVPLEAQLPQSFESWLLARLSRSKSKAREMPQGEAVFPSAQR